MDRTPFIVYRGFRYQNLFDRMADLLSSGKEGEIIGEECREEAYACANELLELAADYGFEGNLWHCFLSFCLANHENAYSTSCEIVGEIEGSLNEIALHDFAIFKEMFDYDFEELEKSLDADCLKIIMDYKSGNSGVQPSCQGQNL